jgi:hypothetical protein
LEAVIRYTGVSRHQPAIDAWLSRQDPVLAAIGREWFMRMRQCGEDVCEVLHDRYPRRAQPRPSVGGAIACVMDAPFAYVNVFAAHVNVGFYQGASLDDPAGLLAGSARFMRHVSLRPGNEVNAAALQVLIDAAYADMKARLAALRELGVIGPGG